jgi:Ala-tRNA(Pro) deacylase
VPGQHFGPFGTRHATQWPVRSRGLLIRLGVMDTMWEDILMSSTPTLNQPYQDLLDWLAKHDVEYEVHEHGQAFTARGAAIAEGVDPRTFAKVVGVKTDDGRTLLCVLDATDHLDLHKARRTVGASDVRLLTEAGLAALAPGCEVGAIPAVGALFGLTTYADYAVREDPAISFNAGSHRFSARVDRAGWERACGVVYGDLAAESDSRPAWARS